MIHDFPPAISQGHARWAKMLSSIEPGNSSDFCFVDGIELDRLRSAIQYMQKKTDKRMRFKTRVIAPGLVRVRRKLE